MKKLFAFFIILSAFFCSAVNAQYHTGVNAIANPDIPQDEIRAVWLTTIKNLDWPGTRASSPASVEAQKQELCEMLDRLKAVRINTVLFQTRMRATVAYPSAIEPWDQCFTGRYGQSPGYDPLKFAIEECHKRGMQLHCWVVTMTLGKWNEYGCQQLRRKKPALVKRLGSEAAMNLENVQTAEYLADICEELTRNYNIDGIHLDYIRYPDAWSRKVSAQKGREYITTTVRIIHDRVKAINPKVLMSCSPIGKFSDLARYSSYGWNAYNRGCQDAQGWLRDGLMDQLYPMIYFKGNNFYPFAIDWAENQYGGKVSAGLGIYFLDPKEGNWTIDEVRRQLNVCRQLGIGQCFFRAKFLTDNHQGLYDFVRLFNNADCWPQPSKASENSTKKPGKELEKPSETGFYQTDSNLLTLHRDHANDAKYILLETLQGTPVATLPWKGESIRLNNVPNGCYWLRSLGKKGVTHRLGMLKLKRP